MSARLHRNTGTAFSKLPRKIFGKLLILLLLLLLLLLHSFLLLRWTKLICLLVQCSTVALYPLDDVATCVSVAPKIRSFPKIFLGTFEMWPLVYRCTVDLSASIFQLYALTFTAIIRLTLVVPSPADLSWVVINVHTHCCCCFLLVVCWLCSYSVFRLMHASAHFKASAHGLVLPLGYLFSSTLHGPRKQPPISSLTLAMTANY